MDNNGTSKWQMTCYIAIILVILVYTLHVGSSLLIPFVFAVFIWFLINTITDYILKIHYGAFEIPSFLARTIAVLMILAGISLLVQVVSLNVSQVMEKAPFYQANLTIVIEHFYAFVGLEEPPSMAQLLSQVNLNAWLSGVGKSLTNLVSNMGVIGFYVLFLFFEQSYLPRKLVGFIHDKKQRHEFLKISSRIQKDVQTYIGIKTLTSFLTGFLSYLVMRMIGLDFAMFWAILIFVLNYIPTIGSIIATFFPTLLALIQFEVLHKFVLILLGLSSIQVVVGNILEPRIMGKSLNLSPLVLILSLSLWGGIWGISGAFLCVPITVVLMIVLSHFPASRPIAILLSKDGSIRSD